MRGESVLRPWVRELSFMQQAVLLSAIRGCDGTAKSHPAKPLNRWYRRCILITAFEKTEINDPYSPGGGSFTGPCVSKSVQVACIDGTMTWQEALQPLTDEFVNARDDLPAHYYFHMIHAFEILGYKHPDIEIGTWWLRLYRRCVESFHVHYESESMMDKRLGDTFDGWVERMDSAGSLQRDARA